MYDLYHKTIARATVTPPGAGCPLQITTVPACTSTTVPQCQYHVPVQYQYDTSTSTTVPARPLRITTVPACLLLSCHNRPVNHRQTKVQKYMLIQICKAIYPKTPIYSINQWSLSATIRIEKSLFLVRELNATQKVSLKFCGMFKEWWMVSMNIPWLEHLIVI